MASGASSRSDEYRPTLWASSPGHHARARIGALGAHDGPLELHANIGATWSRLPRGRPSARGLVARVSAGGLVSRGLVPSARVSAFRLPVGTRVALPGLCMPGPDRACLCRATSGRRSCHRRAVVACHHGPGHRRAVVASGHRAPVSRAVVGMPRSRDQRKRLSTGVPTNWLGGTYQLVGWLAAWVRGFGQSAVLIIRFLQKHNLNFANSFRAFSHAARVRPGLVSGLAAKQ